MIDAIETILRQIYLEIPKEILYLTFEPKKENRSLDAIIKERIIVDIVLNQCSLYAGKVKKITLDADWVLETKTNNYFYPVMSYPYAFYKIPPHAREYKDILYPLDVSLPHYGYSPDTFYTVGTYNNYAREASDALGASSGLDEVVVPTAVLHTTNVIRLEPPQSTHVPFLVSCLLKYDENFLNVSPNVIKSLSKLGVLATKAYIYNSLIVKINQGLLVGGQELSSIKELVDEYKDAVERFEEELVNFRGASSFDKDQMIEMISMMF